MKIIHNYYWVIVILVLLPYCLKGQGFSLGGGAEYNFTINSIGLNARAYYNVGERFCIGPEFSIFARETNTTPEGTEEIRVWEFNFNTHYIFEISEKLGVYPIVGLNYTNEEETFIEVISAEETIHLETSWAANLGAGFHIPFERLTPFGEFHFTTGRLSEYLFTIGTFYTFHHKEE